MDFYRRNPQFLLAEKICQTLQGQGFQALLAGGCVRDFLLHRIPNDFDVATNASPEQVESLFEKTIAVGKAFGVMVVAEGSEQVEVATFRKDGPYVDGRRPQFVEFSQAEEDAQRRDFTINGLFYDLQKGAVLDFVGGLGDLKKHSIRAIGNPAARFEEDHLRLLRAVRFSAQLGFEIESKTLQATEAHRDLIQSVSGERIQDEMTKLLLSQKVEVGLQLLFETGLLESLLGTADFAWLEPHAVFGRRQKTKEDVWFRFFFWLKQMSSAPLSGEALEKLCEKWKFSRDLKSKTLKALKWAFETRPFLRHPLGELLAASYEPESERGLLEYSEFFLDPEEKVHFEKFLSRRLQLGREKPLPWVTARDLAAVLQGEALGQALRSCYWEQLEGTAQRKEDLLKIWGL